MTHPKVFICHASEDKERFVLPFAKRLRRDGIDAWVDQFEIQPGDNLVQKIFQGIKEASTFIAVISDFSVQKDWVQKELSTATVKSIYGKIKIIPIVLDGITNIPESLRDTLWVPISTSSSYESEYKRICNAILGLDDKPKLGPPPSGYNNFPQIGHLSKIDILALKLSCDLLLDSDRNYALVNPREVIGKSDGVLTEEVLLESLEILVESDYINLTKYCGPPRLESYQITTTGFEEYALAFIPEYDAKRIRLISTLLNKDIQSSWDLQRELDEPIILVQHILDYLESRDQLKLSTQAIMGGLEFQNILWVSPQLNRMIR